MTEIEFHTGDAVTVHFSNGDLPATVYRPPNDGGWAIVALDKGIRITVNATQLESRRESSHD